MKARPWIAAVSLTTLGAAGLLTGIGRDAYRSGRPLPADDPRAPARHFEPDGPVRPLAPPDEGALPVYFAESTPAASPHRPAFDWQSAGPGLPPETNLPAVPPTSAPRVLVESTPTPPVIRLPAVPAERLRFRPPVRLPPIAPDADDQLDGGLPSNPSPMPTMRPEEPRVEDSAPRTANLRGANTRRPVLPPVAKQSVPESKPAPAPAFAPQATATDGPALAAPNSNAAPARRSAAGETIARGAAPSNPSDGVASGRPSGSAPLRTGAAVAVARMADEEIRRGFDLAQRNAFFSAREAFIKALRIVASAHDAEKGESIHGTALSAGLRALEESDQFIPQGNGLEAGINVPSIVGSHHTPVLRNKTEGVTALSARRDYYTYAQEQLALAVDGEPIGSMALYALGKLHSELSSQRQQVVPAAETKALVFQQAAVAVSPDNFLAANELGVLLARTGRHEEARDWILHSVKLSPQATTWHNLSVVHQTLGESKLAQLAEQESRRIAKERGPGASQPGGNAPDVRWIQPREFAAQMRVEPGASDSRPATPTAPAPGAQAPTAARPAAQSPAQR